MDDKTYHFYLFIYLVSMDEFKAQSPFHNGIQTSSPLSAQTSSFKLAFPHIDCRRAHSCVTTLKLLFEASASGLGPCIRSLAPRCHYIK